MRTPVYSSQPQFAACALDNFANASRPFNDFQTTETWRFFDLPSCRVYFSRIQLIPLCLCRPSQQNAGLAAGCLAAVFTSKSQQHKHNLYICQHFSTGICVIVYLYICHSWCSAGVFTSKSGQATLPAYGCLLICPMPHTSKIKQIVYKYSLKSCAGFLQLSSHC